MAYDPRIGYRHEESIEWPETDIEGKAYNRPPSATAGVGGNRFVVLPFGFKDSELLDSLRGQFAPPAKSRREMADTEAGE